MSAAAHAALRPAPDELALADARARVTGQKLASGIFQSPVHLASGLRRSQAANDTGENLAAYDEGTSESCYWVARDPIRFDGGVNLYEYARNNPVNLVDRTGRHPEDGSQGGSADGYPWDDPGDGPGGGGKSGGGGASDGWWDGPVCEDPDDEESQGKDCTFVTCSDAGPTKVICKYRCKPDGASCSVTVQATKPECTDDCDSEVDRSECDN